MRACNAEGALHQSCNRFLSRACRADDADHFINVTHCKDQALKAMCLLLRLAKKEGSAAPNDFLAVSDVQIDQVSQRKCSRLAVDQGDVDDRERVLKRSELIELLLHDRRICVLLQDHHDACLCVAAGVVLHIGDLRNTVIPAGIYDFLDQV